MTTLKEMAASYVPTQKAKTKDICELDRVPTDLELKVETAGNAETGETWQQYIATIAGEKYKVHPTILEKLQTILKFAPQLSYVRITKKSTGKTFKNKTGKTFDVMEYSVEPVLA